MKITRRSLLQGFLSVPAGVGLGLTAQVKPAQSAPLVLAPKHISARIWHWDLTRLVSFQIMRTLSGPLAMERSMQATIRPTHFRWDERGDLPHVADCVVIADGATTVFSGWIERLDLSWHENIIDVIVRAHD